MLNPVELYEKMVTIRQLELRLQEMCDRGEAGDLHFNKGQEAISVGACAALAPTDHIVTHHRTIAHQVAKGAELYPLIAEVLGRSSGVCGGRAGEMHISDGRIRHDFSFQLVGTCIPVAAGLAWALKNHHKNGEIVAVFFGDAATSNGQFHEGLNIAAIHKVPLLFICENNQLAGNIKPEHYRANSSVTRAAKASYDLHCIDVDGNDVSAVIEAVQEGERVVRKKGPVLIECATTRLCWHKQGQRDVRSPEELALLAERDPIKNWERKHTEIDKQAVLERVNAALDTAFARALSDPLPEIEHD